MVTEVEHWDLREVLERRYDDEISTHDGKVGAFRGDDDPASQLFEQKVTRECLNRVPTRVCLIRY